MTLIQSKQKKMYQSGLVLAELIVILAIVSVVSGVIVFNYSDFRDNTAVRGLSQEVALAIRKAQTYATSVRPISGSGTTLSFSAYGMSFSVNGVASNSATPGNKRFVLFANVGVTPNSLYDNGGTCGAPVAGNECLETFTINSADTITQVCAVGASSTCVSGTNTVDIFFERPSPDAKICVNGSCTYSSATITVGSLSRSRIITIWNTGQISAQ